MRPCLRLQLMLICLYFSLGGCNATMTKSMNSISDLATSVVSLAEDTYDQNIDLTNHTSDSLCYSLENWKQNRKAVRKELESRGYRTRGKKCIAGGSSTVSVKRVQEHKRANNKSIRSITPAKDSKPATASSFSKPAAAIINTSSSESSSSIEREIIATYGEADEVERFGSAAVFKYCKTGLFDDSYTYVWSDGQNVKQILKGRWTALFLCKGAHRQVDWVRTMEVGALLLVQPTQRPKKKSRKKPTNSFGEAMLDGLENVQKERFDPNRDVKQSIKLRSPSVEEAPFLKRTVECTDGGVLDGLGKRTRTFSGPDCPSGKSKAVDTVKCKKIATAFATPIETFEGRTCPFGYSKL